MKRPFAFLGFSYLLGLLAAFFFGRAAALIGLTVGFAALAIIVAKRKQAAPWKLSLFGFSLALTAVLCVGMLVESGYRDKLGTHRVKGELMGLIGSTEGSSSYGLNVYELDGKPCKAFGVKLYSTKEFIFEPYDSLSATVELKAFEEGRGFSQRKSNFAAGYLYSGSLQRYSPTKVSTPNIKPPAAYTAMLRTRLEQAGDSLFAEDTGDMVAAMLLGFRERLSNEIYENFKLSGINHMLVVSGMHLSVIAGFALLLFKGVNMPRRLRYVLAMVAVLLYMLVAGMGKSIQRSGIMYLLFLLSNIFGEEADGLNSLGFSVLIICIVNPYSGMDLGFLLSVSATAGIITLSGRWNRLLSVKGKACKVLNPIWQALGVSVCAYLFVMPILLFANGQLNPISLVVGTVLALPGGAILILSLIAVLMALVPFLSAAAAPLVIAVNLLAKLLISGADFASGFGAYMPVLPNGTAALLAAGLLLIGAICIRFPRKRLLGLGTAVAVSLFAIVFSAVSMASTPRLITANTGEGIFAFLLKGRSAAVLSCDGYRADMAVNALKRYGVREIVLLNTQPESAIAERLCREYKVKRLMLPGLTPAPKLKAEELIRYERDASARVFGDVEINADLYGKLTTVNAGGFSVALEKQLIESRPISADIGLTSFSETKLDCDYVLISHEEEEMPALGGNYIFSTGDLYCLELTGKTKLRRVD